MNSEVKSQLGNFHSLYLREWYIGKAFARSKEHKNRIWRTDWPDKLSNSGKVNQKGSIDISGKRE